MPVTSDEWRQRPWRCPACGGEDVQVRDVLLPGGPTDDLRRERTATWESRCVACKAQWRSTFIPHCFTVTQTHA